LLTASLKLNFQNC